MKAHTKSHSKKTNQTNQFWQLATLVFAVLFVASLFTSGFSSQVGNPEVVAKEISTALQGAGLLGVEESSEAEIVIVKTLIKEEPEEPPTTTTPTPGATVDEPLSVELYVMSQCPYGVQAEDTLFEAIQNLGEENFDLKVEYISTDLGGGNFQSLHGEPETKGNIAQLCGKEYSPENYLNMVLCMNENAQTIPSNWESCAENLNMPVDEIRTCYEGNEGNELLVNSIKETAKRGATGSPTIYVDDASYSGGRGVNDFTRAFCNAFASERPEACNSIPEPTKFDVIVLNDERCTECQAAQAQLTGSLKGLFPGMQIQTVNYMNEEGKTLFEEAELQFLPAFLFDDNVKETENYARIAQYLLPAGEYTSLVIGASFDPTTEVCDNNIDDTGNDLVDCEDPDCENAMECRETKEQYLDVFIMSDCPYGRKAVEALYAVEENFGENLDFEVHYIASEQGDGFASLHGQYEVDENIVQLCVQEHNDADVWFEYLYCRSTNGVKGIDWKDCAEETGVDIDTVSACFDGEEGANLLREDIKIASALGVGASPTWLSNNKYQFSGIDAQTVKTNFCQYNPDVEGCENTLSADTGSVPAGACG